jgi:hypothetical protein
MSMNIFVLLTNYLSLYAFLTFLGFHCGGHWRVKISTVLVLSHALSHISITCPPLRCQIRVTRT